MRFTVRFAGFLLLVAVSEPALTDNYEITWCDSCQSEEYFQSAYRAAIGKETKVYVADRSKGIVKFYHVTGHFERDSAYLKARLATGDPVVINKILNALSVNRALSGLRRIEQLPGLAPKEQYDSVIDMINRPDRQQKIADAISYYVKNHVDSPLSASIVSKLFLRRDKDPSSELESDYAVKIAYPDGSFTHFKLMNVTSREDGSIALEFNYLSAASQTAAGGPVPQTRSGIVSATSESPVVGPNAEDYKQLAERLDISVKTVCGSKQQRFQCLDIDQGSVDASFACIYHTGSECG